MKNSKLKFYQFIIGAMALMQLISTHGQGLNPSLERLLDRHQATTLDEIPNGDVQLPQNPDSPLAEIPNEDVQLPEYTKPPLEEIRGELSKFNNSADKMCRNSFQVINEGRKEKFIYYQCQSSNPNQRNLNISLRTNERNQVIGVEGLNDQTYQGQRKRVQSCLNLFNRNVQMNSLNSFSFTSAQTSQTVYCLKVEYQNDVQ